MQEASYVRLHNDKSMISLIVEIKYIFFFLIQNHRTASLKNKTRLVMSNNIFKQVYASNFDLN